MDYHAGKIIGMVAIKHLHYQQESSTIRRSNCQCSVNAYLESSAPPIAIWYKMLLLLQYVYLATWTLGEYFQCSVSYIESSNSDRDVTSAPWRKLPRVEPFSYLRKRIEALGGGGGGGMM